MKPSYSVTSLMVASRCQPPEESSVAQGLAETPHRGGLSLSFGQSRAQRTRQVQRHPV